MASSKGSLGCGTGVALLGTNAGGGIAPWDGAGVSTCRESLGPSAGIDGCRLSPAGVRVLNLATGLKIGPPFSGWAYENHWKGEYDGKDSRTRLVICITGRKWVESSYGIGDLGM